MITPIPLINEVPKVLRPKLELVPLQVEVCIGHLLLKPFDSACPFKVFVVMIKNFLVLNLSRVLLFEVSGFGGWILIRVETLPENVLFVFLNPVGTDYVCDCVGARES